MYINIRLYTYHTYKHINIYTYTTIHLVKFMDKRGK